MKALWLLALAVGVGVLLPPSVAAAEQERVGPPTPAEASPTPVYKIGPADVLQVVVWKEADLSRDVIVRFDGMVTLPLVGEVQAAGRTPQDLASDLAKKLERFVEVPLVTVGVGEANSARFYVVGQVMKSGGFPLSGRTTVLQGLALAGGFQEFAKTDSIVIVREDRTVIPANFKRIAEGKDMAQNVLLAPGDTIVVP